MSIKRRVHAHHTTRAPLSNASALGLQRGLILATPAVHRSDESIFRDRDKAVAESRVKAVLGPIPA